MTTTPLRLLPLALITACVGGSSRHEVASGEIQYLSFQLMTDANEVAIDQLVSVLGGGGDGERRQLAFAVGPITLSHSDAEMRHIIGRAFDVARAKNVAVAIHIDDSMFWEARTDLIADPANVEWSDWSGALYPSRVIGWAPKTLAPPICYESPTIRSEIRRIAIEVIGAEIVTNLRALEGDGRGHLFAGVIGGWETRLDDDRQPRVQFGYCSLTNLGFSAANPPPDLDAELVRVVARWIALWSESLAASGIPPEKVYTHVPITAGALDVHAPPHVAFNEFSRPGFSAYATQLHDLLSAAEAELALHDNPRWAVAEGANAMVGCKRETNPLSWEVYLGKLFNRGAALVNIFAWTGGRIPAEAQMDPDGVAATTNSDEAISAYRKFLQGETLDPSDAPLPEITCEGSVFGAGGSAAELQVVLQELHAALQRAAQQGVDLTPVADDMRELDAMMQAGDVAGATDKARSILEVVSALSPN